MSSSVPATPLRNDEVEGELRDLEAEVYDRAVDMGRLRGEFAFNQAKLRESYHPKVLPLFTSLHVCQFYQTQLCEQIAWLEEKLVALVQYKEGFFEARDLARARQTRLERAKPQLEDSIASLEAVMRPELTVLRAYENPPPIVLETVLVVMQVRNEDVISWDAAKVLLSETYYYAFFTSKCRNHIRAHPTPTKEQLEALERYCLNPEAQPSNVLRASVPAGAMSHWLHALYKYYFYDQITTPRKQSEQDVREELNAKRLALEEQKEEVRAAEQKLKVINDEVGALVLDLRDRYDSTMEPLQESFFDANHRFNEVFGSPRRRTASPQSPQRFAA
jgi:hypothetical protein